jgi:hypothetical protein
MGTPVIMGITHMATTDRIRTMATTGLIIGTAGIDITTATIVTTIITDTKVT